MIRSVPSPTAGRTKWRTIIPAALAVATALGLGGVHLHAQGIAPSLRHSTFIAVAHDVQLEVVDWGGEGPTLILLAGGGHTAHVFDGFAPRLTSRLRVLGITRRGVGASSRPTSGYDSTTLVGDLIAVLDSLGLKRVSFAGHSFAGSEMSILAARFPDRVERLIYLDSAFDYRQLLDRVGVATALGSPQPPIGTYDRGTVADSRLLGERSSGAGFPESEVRQMFRVGPDDIVQGSATAPEVLPAMLAGIEPAPLTAIRAPALALYAAPTSAEVMYPSWYAFDQAARKQGQTVYAAVSAEHAVQRARFKREVAGSRQVIITGARHYLFLTHPGEVAHEILSFMLGT
jgi:pimeloyl-ACP methyl ester carboxylesterase